MGDPASQTNENIFYEKYFLAFWCFLIIFNHFRQLISMFQGPCSMFQVKPNQVPCSIFHVPYFMFRNMGDPASQSPRYFYRDWGANNMTKTVRGLSLLITSDWEKIISSLLIFIGIVLPLLSLSVLLPATHFEGFQTQLYWRKNFSRVPRIFKSHLW